MSEVHLPALKAIVEPETRASLRSWGPWLVVAMAIAGLLLLFSSTALSALHQWDTSSAYTYGYLIAPVSAYLLWIDRDALRGLAARPSFIGMGVVASFSAAWLAADLLGIDQGRHLALVGMIQGIILAVLGVAIYRRAIFAFSYLWLMVPAGEFLLRPLQEIAHAGSVLLLRLSAIPTYTEGVLIEVPQGSFLVEPGCAGLNFFLAALALSLVYGKVMYSRISQRVTCVALALGVSVVSNIVRIYLIIALTEWTEQRIGLADDHLLFGWGFFAVIMLALMWVGARWAAPLAPVSTPSVATPSPRARWSAAVGAACLALAALAPLLSNVSEAAPTASIAPFTLPRDVGTWRSQPAAATAWRPATVPGDGTLEASYASQAAAPMDLSVTYYDAQRDGREAAAAGNGPAEAGRWHMAASETVVIPGGGLTVAAATVEANGRVRRVFYWYDAGGCVTASRLHAKLCTARERLLHHSSVGAFVAVSAEGDGAAVDADLSEFVKRLPPFTGPAVLVDEKG